MHSKESAIAVLFGIIAIINPAVSTSTIVQPGDYTFIVSLRRNVTPTGEHYCSGVIINADTILTASYCITPRTDYLMVAAGTISSQHVDEKHVYYVKEMKRDQPAAGLATFHLNQSITFDTGVQPVQYASSLPASNLVDLVGWGAVHKTTGSRVKYLHQVQLHLAEASICNKHCSESLTESEKCGKAHDGEGLCEGDPGAPVIHDKKLVGIFQRGEPCTHTDWPVFTNVVGLAPK